MEKEISALFRLMSISLVCLVSSCDKGEQVRDPNEELDQMVLEEVDNFSPQDVQIER